jgi:hypothetical protein
VQNLGALPLVRQMPFRSDIEVSLVRTLLCRSWYDELSGRGWGVDPRPAVFRRR